MLTDFAEHELVLVVLEELRRAALVQEQRVHTLHVLNLDLKKQYSHSDAQVGEKPISAATDFESIDPKHHNDVRPSLIQSRQHI